MRSLVAVVLMSVLASLAAAAPALAEPASGPRQEIDQTFTTTAPNTPTGVGWDATYHAAGDPSSPPPYMERMTFYPPEGFRFDTSVPESCTATDAELAVRGPAACPAGSLVGQGETEGLFMAPITKAFVFHEFWHRIYLMNNAGEQIVLVEAEGFEVMRGKFQPDGSLEFNPTTCFPRPPTGCADDYIIQLRTTSFVPAYTNAKGSYATTPPTCPESGYWDTTVRFWWKDGNEDAVVTRQPCSSA
jgi:hypothetical protein